MRRIGRFAFSWSLLGLTLAGAPATADAASTSTSSNWAGYAVTRTSSAGGFHSVSGSWVVPSGDCSTSSPAYSATWVGLGGLTEQSRALEQTGTEFDCSADGSASYSAWYELVPAAGRTIPMTVRPGDTIDASVTVRATHVTLLLRNRTRHATFRRTFTMSDPDVSSAEWIVEAPSDCNGDGRCVQLPLSDFGTATFRRAYATGSGGRRAAAGWSAWSLTRIELSGGDSPRFGYADTALAAGATPSDLAGGGNSFSVSYDATRSQTSPSSA